MQIVRLLIFSAILWAAVPAGTRFAQELPSEDARPESTQPFSIGERLVYLIKWDPPWYLFFLPKMEAGQIELHLAGETEFKNQRALKISFQAHSSGKLMTLAGMKVEDEFVFLTEPETFCSLSASKKIREGKRKRHIDITFLRDTRQLHIREMDESVDPPKLKKDETKNDIPRCVQDPFSAIYFYRRSDLRLQHTQDLLIGHDDRFKEIRTLVEKQEILDTVLGKIPAWNVKTVSLMGGLFKGGGQFRIWFSADERKLPLQFEVKVNLGRVFGKLISTPD